MSKSKYKQILSELKKQLLEAKFSSANPFPSEAAVAREKQTTRNTVHRAFIELRRLGLIEGEPGVAPRVASRKVSRKIGLIVPGVVYSEFFQPIVGEISRLSQDQGYTLLFGNITSKDPVKRAAQAKRFAKELVREGVAGVIYQPLEFIDDAVTPNAEIVAVFDKAILQSAVRRTFERRQTPMPNGLPMALTDEFATNAKKIAQWKGFCRKSRIETIPLSEVLAQLADKVDEYELFSARTS